MTWRPRYSWRTLLVVTIVTGVVVGLYVRHRWRRELEEDFRIAIVARDHQAARECLKIDPELAKRVTYDKKATPLHIAVLRLDTAMLKLLIDAGADVNGRDVIAGPPLHYAANYGWVEGARILLRSGADVSAADESGRTALHWAGRVEVCELLIQHGADLEATDSEGRTPVAYALHNGNLELVELFRKHGAKEPTQ